jgi:hypothetical protein
MQCKDFINNFPTLYLTVLKISKLDIKNIDMEHNIDCHDQIQAIGIQGK